MWLGDLAQIAIDRILPSLTVIVSCNRYFIVRRYRNSHWLWRRCGFLEFLLSLGFLFIEPGRLPPAHFLQLSVGLGRWYVKRIPHILELVVTLDRVHDAQT